MLGRETAYQVNKYYNDKVHARSGHVHKSIHRLTRVVHDILKHVEQHEPRFISTLVENNGRYDGLIVHSPNEYEVMLYLNQMGVFNFVDDGSIPGCAVLKLSDGRKRSMSLWVEFITASGYLSARKIRGRFQTLVSQTVDKPPFRDCCQLLTDSSDVRIRIDDAFVVQITCAFRCSGIWPRSAAHWPNTAVPWPGQQLAAQVKTEGFDLSSRDTTLHQMNTKQANSMEGDAFAITMHAAENHLLAGSRRKCYSILKCLRDTHLEFPGSPVTNYVMKTLILCECEKHSSDYDWEDNCLGDRIIGVLLQLVQCLQCRRCAHYFLPHVDLLRGQPPQLIERAAHYAWALARRLMLDAEALEHL